MKNTTCFPTDLNWKSLFIFLPKTRKHSWAAICEDKEVIKHKHEVRITYGRRRWGRRHEVAEGMTAACGRGICHILSSDSMGEIYSIASAVLGNHELGSTSTHTHAHTHARAGPAKLIWVLTTAQPPCREAVAVGRDPDHFGQYH